MWIRLRKAFVLSVVTIILIAIGLVFCKSVPEPPVTSVDFARISLSLAAKNHAQVYAPGLFSEATALYDSAMARWRKENQRFILFRDYTEVTEFAEKSAKKSQQAARSSKQLAKSLEITLQLKLDSLNALTSNLNGLLKRLPLSEDTRNHISRGKLLLKESEVEFHQGDYLTAGYKASKAENLLVPSFRSVEKDLRDYFRSLPLWKKLVHLAIKRSSDRKNLTIIIDKFARKLYVYHSGIQKYSFDADLGPNWMQHKRIKGDKATPEGVYMVKSKIPPGKTKYYRALLLNYPNEEDLARFEKDRKDGLIPQNASIGGLIEIHGQGGKQADWTDGCIALQDSDMLKLYNMVSTGTPVIIVGSMEDLPAAMAQHTHGAATLP